MQEHTTPDPAPEFPTHKKCTDRKCERYGEWLPISEFHRLHSSPDGHKRICKHCSKRRLNEWRKRPHAKKAAALHQREYRKTPNGRKLDREGKRKYRQSKKGRLNDAMRRKRDRAKMKARERLNSAVKYGHLPRPDTLICIQCGQPAAEYHHHLGYARKHHFDVVPVCKDCHAQLDFDPSVRKY